MKIIPLKKGSKYVDFIINTQFWLIRQLLNVKQDGSNLLTIQDNSEILPSKYLGSYKRRFDSKPRARIQLRCQFSLRT